MTIRATYQDLLKIYYLINKGHCQQNFPPQCVTDYGKNHIRRKSNFGYFSNLSYLIVDLIYKQSLAPNADVLGVLSSEFLLLTNENERR